MIKFYNHLFEEERAGCIILIAKYCCFVAVSVLCLFLTVSLVGLCSVSVAFPGHTHLLFKHIKQVLHLKFYLFILVGERMGSKTLKRLKSVVRFMYL